MKNLAAASASSSPLLLFSRALLLLWMPDVLRLFSLAVSEALVQPVTDMNNSNIKDVHKLLSELSPATVTPNPSHSPAIVDVTAQEKPARRPQITRAAALSLRSSPPAPVNEFPLMSQISVVLGGADTKAEPTRKPPGAVWLPQQPPAVEVLAQRQNQLLGNLRHSEGNNEKEQSVVPVVAPLRTPVSAAFPTGVASAQADNTALVAQASPGHSEGVYTPAVNGPSGVDRPVTDNAAVRAAAGRAAAAAAAGAQGGAAAAGKQLPHPLPSSVAHADISETGVQSPLTYLSSPLSVQTEEKTTKQHARQQHLQHHDKHKQSHVTYTWPPAAAGGRATSAAVRYSPLNKGPTYKEIQVPHTDARYTPLLDLLYWPRERRGGDYGVHEQFETSLHGKNQLSPAFLDLLTKANQEAGSSSTKTGRGAVPKGGRLQLPSLPALFLDLSDILEKHKFPISAVDKAPAAAAATKQVAGAAAVTADQRRLAEPWSVKKHLASSFAFPTLDSLLSQARVETTAAGSKEGEARVLANAAAAAGGPGAAEAEGLLRGKDARGRTETAAGEEGTASIEASAGDTEKDVPQMAIPVQQGGQLPLGHKQQAAVGAEARSAPESRAARRGGGAAAGLEGVGQALSETPAESRTAEPVAAPNHEAPLKPIVPSSAAHLAWIIEQMKSRPPFGQANAADRPQQKHPRGQAEGQKVIQSEKPLQLPGLEPRNVGGFPTLNVEEKYPHRERTENDNARREVVDDQFRLEEEKSKREESLQKEAEDKLLRRTRQGELSDVIAAIAAVVKERAEAVKRAADAGGGSLFAPIFVEQSQISEQQQQRPSRSAAGELHLPVWGAGTRSVNDLVKPGGVEGEQISTTALDTRTPGAGLTDASTIPSHSFMKVDTPFPPALGPEAHDKHEMKRKFGPAKKKLKEANKRAGEKRKKKKAKSAKRRRAGQDHKNAGKHARAASAYGKPTANARPAHRQQEETAAARELPAAAAAEAHAPVKVAAEASAVSAAVPFQQYGLPSHEHALSAPPPSATGHVNLRGSPASTAPVSSVPLFFPLPTDTGHPDAKTRGPRSGDRPVLAEVEYLDRSPASPEERTPGAADISEASTTAETKKKPKATRHRDFLDGQFLVSTEKEKLGTDLGIRKRIDKGDILHEAWKALKEMAATTSSSGRLLYLRLMKKLPWSWDRFVRELPPVDDSVIPEFRSIRRQLEERNSEVLIVNSPSPALRHLVRTERPEAVFSHGLVIKARVVDARRTAKSASEINGLLKIVPRSPFTLSAYAAWVSRPGVSSPMELRYEAKLRGKAAEGEGDNKGAEIDKPDELQEALKKGKKKEKYLHRSVLYVVTPRARGDIDDYIREKRYPIDVELTAAEMLYALYLLHSSGFIHRDIKLMNYFVTFDGHVVLGDFDGVWPIGIPVSTRDHLLYTKGYLAPEVDINKKYADYTEKSDIYALGICFKELHEAKPQMHNAEAFKNLYRRMTAINPEKRPTALQAMQHHYFRNVNFSTLELLKHPPPLPGTFTINAGFYG